MAWTTIDATDVRNHLADLRATGMSLAHIARTAGVHTNSLARIARGQDTVRVDTNTAVLRIPVPEAPIELEPRGKDSHTIDDSPDVLSRHHGRWVRDGLIQRWEAAA